MYEITTYNIMHVLFLESYVLDEFQRILDLSKLIRLLILEQ